MNYTKIVLGFGALLIIFMCGVSYHLLIIQPKIERQHEIKLAEQKEQAQIEAELRRELKYESCMNTAWTNYSADWDNKCKLEGLDKDCTLMKYQYEGIESRYKESKDRCVQMYN